MTILHLCLCDISANVYNKPVPCYGCGGCGYDCHYSNPESTQKRIQKQVRISESQLTNVIGAFNIGRDFLMNGPGIGLQTMSDRTVPSVQKRYVGRRGGYKGNSVKYSITSHKPGSMGPQGVGVDVKHGSYARYLGKLTAPHLAVTKEVTPPLYGNKTKNLSLINNGCKLCHK